MCRGVVVFVCNLYCIKKACLPVIAVIVVVVFVVDVVSVVVVVFIVYLKHLRIVLRCAEAGCGMRTSSL